MLCNGIYLGECHFIKQQNSTYKRQGNYMVFSVNLLIFEWDKNKDKLKCLCVTVFNLLEGMADKQKRWCCHHLVKVLEDQQMQKSREIDKSSRVCASSLWRSWESEFRNILCWLNVFGSRMSGTVVLVEQQTDLWVGW